MFNATKFVSKRHFQVFQRWLVDIGSEIGSNGEMGVTSILLEVAIPQTHIHLIEELPDVSLECISCSYNILVAICSVHASVKIPLVIQLNQTTTILLNNLHFHHSSPHTRLRLGM